MSDFTCTLQSLFIHPIKSCASVSVREALLIETGLELDRAWMAIDSEGLMLTQREHPRLALVAITVRLNDMVLRAPGMLALHLSLDAVEKPTHAQVWRDVVKAYDMGAIASQWFSDYLGLPGSRLVRFDPEEKRFSDSKWTGVIAAENGFSDGFPLMVASTASLAELNRRLALEGHDAVTMQRFRPNLVLDGLAQAHDEDFIDTLQIETGEGTVQLKLVKPCERCSIPDIDPATAEAGGAVSRALAGYRSNARMGGAITFGMNAVIVSGIEQVLRVGARVSASLAA